MKPIFISYSSRHRDLTRDLATAIEAQYGAGSVWWDQALESWGDYEVQIRNALHAARAVVVIWTRAAGESDWVKSEAGRANAAGKLVNLRAADTPWSDVPGPYDQHHVNRLDDLPGILRSIDAVWTGRPVRTAVPLHEIYQRQHGRALIDPKQQGLARDPREVSPTDLLQAKYELVDYIDVAGTRAALRDWCGDATRATAGRLVHGPGGLGKTRLMISVAARLRALGWTAGFLERAHDPAEPLLRQRWQALEQVLAHGDDAGLLLVLDYAEARADEVLRITERLCQRAPGDTRPVRLVLLARAAGEWWERLFDESPEVQRIFRGAGAAPDVCALPQLSSGRQRTELFEASLRAFGPLLAAQGYAPPAAPPEPEHLRRIDAGAGYTRPLAVQMEALLWLAAATPPAGDTSVASLLRRVLGMERQHWGKIRGAVADAALRDIARAVAQVTAVQGVPTEDATARLLMADGFYQGQRTARVAIDPVLRDLAHLYGRPDGSIGQLEPDLIGEHHVATVADTELVDACLAWIATEAAAQQARPRRDIVLVLQRATAPEHGDKATRRAIAMLDHLVARHLQTLAPDMVAVMVDTPGALAARLDLQVDRLDGASLAAVDAALPLQSLSLMDLSLHVAQRRLDLARAQMDLVDAAGRGAAPDVRESSLREVGARVGQLGIRLSSLGRREEALAASQEAVEIRRRLAQTRPDAFLPDLAASLNNLGIRLSNLGRREEALAASQEAVEIYRRLAQTRPDAFLPDLATSISVMSDVLAALDRNAAAAQAAQEALELLAPFVESYPQTYGSLARKIGADVRRYCEAAGTTPDEELLMRVVQALGGPDLGQQPP